MNFDTLFLMWWCFPYAGRSKINAASFLCKHVGVVGCCNNEDY